MSFSVALSVENMVSPGGRRSCQTSHMPHHVQLSLIVGRRAFFFLKGFFKVFRKSLIYFSFLYLFVAFICYGFVFCSNMSKRNYINKFECSKANYVFSLIVIILPRLNGAAASISIPIRCANVALCLWVRHFTLAVPPYCRDPIVQRGNDTIDRKNNYPADVLRKQATVSTTD